MREACNGGVVSRANGFHVGVLAPRKDEGSGNDVGLLNDSRDTPARVSDAKMRPFCR